MIIKTIRYQFVALHAELSKPTCVQEPYLVSMSHETMGLDPQDPATSCWRRLPVTRVVLQGTLLATIMIMTGF